MPRITLLALLALPMLLATTDVTPAAEAIAGQTLSVLLPPWGTLPKAMSDDFEKQTGVHLDLQTLGWDDIRTKIVTSEVAGNAPADVTEVDWSWVGQFGAAGWYSDLTGKIDAATVSDIPTTRAFVHDGKLLAVPYNNDFRILIYNRQMFASAGLSAAPTTIDALTKDAAKLKSAHVVDFPIALPLSASEGTATAWYMLTKAFGGELFGADGKPQFTAPDSAGSKALAWEMDQLHAGLITPAATGMTDVQVQDEVKNGRAAIDVAGWAGNPGVYDDKTKSKVAGQMVAAVLPGVDGRSRSFGLPDALGIPANAKHQAAALAFIAWWMQPGNQIAADHALGNLPTRTSVLQTLNAQKTLVGGDVLLAEVPHIEPLFPGGTPPWYPQFSAAASSAINQAAKGQITVTQAMTQIAAAAQDAQQQ